MHQLPAAADDILIAGEFAASGASLADSTGWDFGSASSTASQLYFFDVAAELDGGQLTSSLNWQRTMTATDTQPGPGTNYVFSGTLANLELSLYSATGFTLDSLLAESISSLNNTELIWEQGVAAGRYAFEVTSDTNAIDYGLAWTVTVPEPATWALAVAAAVSFAAASRRLRSS